MRRRGALIVGVLLAVNALVFWRSDPGERLRPLGAAIGSEGQLRGTAVPSLQTCDGRSTRVFDGLDEQLHQQVRLARGKTLRLGLLEVGVRPDAVDEVEAALRAYIDLSMLSSRGSALRAAFDRTGGVAALELEITEGHVVQLCRESGELSVRTLQHPLRTDVAVLKFEMPRSGSLFDAVREVGERGELARAVGGLLGQDVDFAVESRPGDQVTVIVEKRFLGQDFHRYGPVLAVRYTGAMGPRAYYLADPDGEGPRYFDRKGQPMSRTLLRSPVGTHPFDAERRGGMVPTVEFVDGRIGLVYERERGTPVISLSAGKVTFVGRPPDEGLVVEIALDDHRRVRYGHLDRVVGDLEVGTRVSQGQIVGVVGHSGQARSDRLRVEFLEDGVLMDPSAATRGDRAWTRREETVLSGDRLAEFKRDIHDWRRALIRG